MLVSEIKEALKGFENYRNLNHFLQRDDL